MPVRSNVSNHAAHRSRWAAIGAAVAVTLGSGGLLTTSASIGSGERGVYVPIAPCRLFDTRPAPDNVGPRNTKLGPGDTFVATVRGTNGNCTIPTDAVGLTMNVAIINPSSNSFLTVFPSDVPRPLAANANWTAGQPPLSNAVTADISGDGKIAFYNLAGTVDVAADIVGYYIDHTHDDRYYTKTQIDTAISGSRVAIDSLGNVGSYPSIAIGADGLPVIAYSDSTNADLKVAKCANAGCIGLPTLTTVDSTGSTGLYASIAVGTDGNPVIAYLDGTNNDLRVAKCANPACTGPSTLTTLDANGNTGYFTSIAIGTDGNPVVSYYDLTSLDLRVAKCVNPACTGTPTTTTVDAPGDVGAYNSVKVRANGLPIISYLDATNGDLKVASCVNAACTGTSTLTPAYTTGSVGYYTSLAIATTGNPIIASYDATNLDLVITRCANPECTGVSVSSALDTVSSTGAFSSIAIGADGNPVITYLYNTDNDLRLAACGNPTCAGPASITTVESFGVVGYYASLAIGADGRPIIAHYDVNEADLRVAKCATMTCSA